MMKKKDFVTLYQELGNIESFTAASQQVELFMEVVKVAMEKDELIILRKFGNFEKRILKGRTGRNPKTGEELITETKYRVNFRPASTFNKRIDDFTKAKEAEEAAKTKKKTTRKKATTTETAPKTTAKTTKTPAKTTKTTKTK